VSVPSLRWDFRRLAGPRRPVNPRLVLLVAIALPAGGHVVLGQVHRALQYLFFMLVLGWLTACIAQPTVSVVGRHAAGFFVYALSITDAYRVAARRRTVYLAQ
jgi:hypothetical protein